MGTVRNSPPRPTLGPLALWVLAALATACSSEIAMEAARTPGQPDATIQYSAVRSGARQFGDYSVVDRTILSDSAAETAESDDVEQGPKVTEPPAW